MEILIAALGGIAGSFIHRFFFIRKQPKKPTRPDTPLWMSDDELNLLYARLKLKGMITIDRLKQMDDDDIKKVILFLRSRGVVTRDQF